MKIAEYFSSDAPTRARLLGELKKCDWGAGKFLVQLLENGTFETTLGGAGRLFFLCDTLHVASFLTLTRQDCVVSPDRFPWVGFVFTFPEYRGRRCAGILLDHARKCAAQEGFPFVYLATDHVGLYEKYGFFYLENATDVYGEESRVYAAPAADVLTAAESARARADAVLRDCGVREAWEAEGATVNQVGSMAMGLLMKHRDLDFHIYTDTLDSATGFRAIARICANPAAGSLLYRNLAATEEACLEWHLDFCRNAETWQIDMIQILRGSRYDGYFEHVASRIAAVLTPETRRAILRLKALAPEAGHIAGIEFYQAVLSGGVRTYPELLAWRKAHPASGIVEWCP